MPAPTSFAAERLLATAALALVIGGCGAGSGQAAAPVHFHFTFDEDPEDWVIGFADYPVGTSDAEQESIDEFYQLGGGHARLPEPLDTADGAVRLTGNNHSDDLLTADGNGEAWLLPGTDSGFEGATTIYYTEIEAIFLEADGS